MCFYHIINYLYIFLPCFISGYALETRRLRDVGFSFTHDTRVLRKVFGFSLGTWSLWILDSEFAQTSGYACTEYHTIVFDLASVISLFSIRGYIGFDLICQLNRCISIRWSAKNRCPAGPVRAWIRVIRLLRLKLNLCWKFYGKFLHVISDTI